MRVRTLKQLAGLINDLDNGYRATIEQSRSSTDRKPRGFRYITSPGKGRTGNRIRVFDPKGVLVIDHNLSETYRTVEEAIVKAIEIFGEDKLNVDPDEVLEVGDEVQVSDFGTNYGTIEKVTMRKGSKTRVREYHVKLRRSTFKFPSRKVRKL